MSSFDYKKALAEIPHKPGVYQYYDADDQLLYIGKAKNLRNRVASYFNQEKSQLNGKTRVLVSKIRRIHFTIVDTEIDAWLLENNLIKKHKPKYNILLKDDKTYPWIVIKNEAFPRIFSTRKMIKDGSKYFGPYASGAMMHTILDLIKDVYPLRTCNLALTDKNINEGKFKVCLEYQIGNCKGPCQAYQSHADYAQNISEIKDILDGKVSSVIKEVKRVIKEAAAQLAFETAHQYQLKLEHLEKYQSKSTVVSSSITNVDVLSIASDEQYAFVNFFKVMNGSIIQTQTIVIKKRLDESDEELLLMAMAEFRAKFNSLSREIIVPFPLPSIDPQLKFIVPKLGDKKKLLELSQKNVLFFKKERLNQYEKLNPELKTERILTQIKNDLRLTQLPYHMECFDNSNFQGQYPVSAIVVFKNAKPSKKDYRHFNVKTVIGPNDFATMEEAVYRRYARLLNDGEPLPQLVIIDGGKGQLSSALTSLKRLGIEKRMTVIGIAKRLEELYYPGDSLPLYLDKKSETLKVIQQMRDEAHRFGITFHRKKRDQGTLKTELEQIPGIGKGTATKLLTHFKSVANIRKASPDELKTVLNSKQLKSLMDYFN